MVAEAYLGLSEETLTLAENTRRSAEAEAGKIAAEMDKRGDLSSLQIDTILAQVRERQKAVGYGGNYREWIAKVTPPDLQ